MLPARTGQRAGRNAPGAKSVILQLTPCATLCGAHAGYMVATIACAVHARLGNAVLGVWGKLPEDALGNTHARGLLNLGTPLLNLGSCCHTARDKKTIRPTPSVVAYMYP